MNVAMHISSGIIDGTWSLVFGAVALVLLAYCLTRARLDLSERLTPMAGLVAAFIFAVQMLNFPVLPGVSGHLLGGALAAALVGPWIGALCVCVVLIVQALVFADGGVAALGLNITNMALLGTAVGYLVLVGMMRILPRTAAGVGLAVFGASVLSVTLASQGFVLEFFLGGAQNLTIGYGRIAATMAGVHVLIGIGEGLIAAAAVSTVAKVRPDLVYVLQGRRLEQPAEHPVPVRRLVLAGLAVAAVLAGGVSYLASGAPDGLDATTRQGCTVGAAGEIDGGTCMALAAKDHELAGSFLADYGIRGIDNSTGLAGVLGVGLTFLLGFVIFRLARRRRAGHGATSGQGDPAHRVPVGG